MPDKDRQEEREYRRTTRGAPQLPTEAAGGLGNPPPYRDDPNAEDIGLDANAQTRLLDEDDEGDAPVRPVRNRKRGCCVCCGIRLVSWHWASPEYLRFTVITAVISSSRPLVSYLPYISSMASIKSFVGPGR